MLSWLTAYFFNTVDILFTLFFFSFCFFFIRIFSLQVLLLFPSLFFSSLFPFFLSFFISLSFLVFFILTFHFHSWFSLFYTFPPPTLSLSSYFNLLLLLIWTSCLPFLFSWYYSFLFSFSFSCYSFFFLPLPFSFFSMFLSHSFLNFSFHFPTLFHQPHHLLLRNFPSPPLCSSPSIFNCAFLLFCFHIFLFSSSWSPFIPLHISFILSISLIFFIFFFLSFSSLLFFFNYTFTFPHISLPFSFISSFLFFTPFFISFFSSSLSRPHFH